LGQDLSLSSILSLLVAAGAGRVVRMNRPAVVALAGIAQIRERLVGALGLKVP